MVVVLFIDSFLLLSLFFALPSLPPMSFILFMLKTITLPPALAQTKLDCVNTSFLCLG